MTRFLGVAVVSGLAALALVSVASRSHETVTLGVVGRTNEHVSLAAAGDDVAAAWSVADEHGGGAEIYTAVSHDGAATFGAPVRVARDASVNGEQPPRVVLVAGADGRPAPLVVWTAKSAAGTRLLSARSSDGGWTFGTPAIVPGTDAPGNRGWQSVAVDRGGRVIVVWLDHRDAAASGAMDHHQHDMAAAAGAPHDADDASARLASSVERAGASQLYVGSIDGTLPARGLVRGVCYCCKTTVAAGAAGHVVAAWRHVYAGGERDIAFASSDDAGATFDGPTRVSRDAWRLDGCPENGPALALDGRDGVHVVWPTLVTDRGRDTLGLFLASAADGRTFGPRTRLPIGDAAYHPQVAWRADDESLLIAWDEGSRGTRQVRWVRAMDAHGVVHFDEIQRGGDGVYPAVAASGRGVVVAWTSRATVPTRIEVRRLSPP